MDGRSYSVVLSGEAGQGLKTIESLFMVLLQKSGYHAFIAKEFMSRVRGGNNTSEIRISDRSVGAFITRIDLLVVLSRNGLSRLLDRIDAHTLIIGEEAYITSEPTKGKLLALPVMDLMKELGNSIYSNNFFNGFLSGVFGCDESIALSLIAGQFAAKGEEIVQKNQASFRMGLEQAQKSGTRFVVEKDKQVLSMHAVKGYETIGIGALSGGLGFVASYPMSPATTVLAYLAKHERSHGVLVEQAEDEIAAINMALGAWYAGSRSMVTTSGGGFALMTEGISLSGVTETPVVVHLAQRPGPGTGLPTRTEQGDLNLALYAGHGEFPRVILSPGTYEDGVNLTYHAFETADAFQIPVFVLTDQHFLDSEGLLSPLDFSKFTVHNHIIKTKTDYQRYALTESGLSPRGIPGYGDGFVCVDSDEHTEGGRITESATVRVQQMDKRLRKVSSYQDVPVRLVGAKDYSTLVVGWGSSYPVIAEAVEQLGHPGFAFAFFPQVYPLPKETRRILEKAKTLVIVENNASAQFAQLIRRETGITFDKTILQYNGSPFAVEQLVESFSEVLA
ncbi:MAG: 2-oxoacid:acceptor oxidoreductase subunit alpha [Sphaerochaeta sp.]|uniref:2-oxoacid:acceptor oxidoreductase subunit alpha n=1 Tax=Sphaerochaeta sp. TaxID=1972642 RepID=UPI002FCC4E9C